jgi:hypothetical protein
VTQPTIPLSLRHPHLFMPPTRARAQIEQTLIPPHPLRSLLQPTDQFQPSSLSRPPHSAPYTSHRRPFGLFRLSTRPKLRIPSPPHSSWLSTFSPIFTASAKSGSHGEFLLHHHTRTIRARLLTTPLGPSALSKSWIHLIFTNPPYFSNQTPDC